jgi:hypothetical protein
VSNLTISIPVELDERLKVVREGVKVSKICQDALEHEIAVQEFYQAQKAGSSAAVVERLKIQKAHAENTSHDDGRKYGFREGSKADYNVLMILDHYRDEIGSGDFEDVNIESIQMVTASDFMEKKIGYDSSANHIDKADNIYTTTMVEKFNLGFIRGMLDFWDSIKDGI